VAQAGVFPFVLSYIVLYQAVEKVKKPSGTPALGRETDQKADFSGEAAQPWAAVPHFFNGLL
jgi:hypothetical protein